MVLYDYYLDCVIDVVECFFNCVWVDGCYYVIDFILVEIKILCVMEGFDIDV